jgi:hypothetical protein
VHDDAADVGHRWRPQDSPRAAAARLLADRPLPAPAAEARSGSRARPSGPASPRAPTAARRRLGCSRTPARSGPAARDHPVARDRLRARLLPSLHAALGQRRLGRVTADALDRLDETLAAVGGGCAGHSAVAHRRA